MVRAETAPVRLLQILAGLATEMVAREHERNTLSSRLIFIRVDAACKMDEYNLRLGACVARPGWIITGEEIRYDFKAVAKRMAFVDSWASAGIYLSRSLTI